MRVMAWGPTTAPTESECPKVTGYGSAPEILSESMPIRRIVSRKRFLFLIFGHRLPARHMVLSCCYREDTFAYLGPVRV